LRIEPVNFGGAVTYPTHHPVSEKVLLKLFTGTQRLRKSGKAIGGVWPFTVEGNVLINLIRDARVIKLLA